MTKTILFMIALAFSSLLANVSSLPAPDDERYFDKQLNRELINWLASMHFAKSVNNPFPYYSDNSLTIPMPKRNSELINSLLSLPKNMNDAGK